MTNTIKVGYIPIVNCSSIFIAQDKGYFQDNKLDIELVSSIGGQKIMNSLAKGEVDIGFSNVASTIFGFDDGSEFVSIVGGATQDKSCPVHAIFVRQDSPIQTVAGLVNTKIAVNTNRAIDEVMVPPLLVKYGVKPVGLQFIPIPFAEMIPALKREEVDAIVAIEPFVAIGKSDFQLRLLSYNYIELQPVTEISSMVTMKSWLEENTEAALAFRKAIIRAAEFAKKYPQETKEILVRYVPLEKEILDRVILPGFIAGSLNPVLLDETIEQMRKANWLNTQFDAKDLIWNLDSSRKSP
jgi:NitT/TauT family transport system substrate-binding protein